MFARSLMAMDKFFAWSAHLYTATGLVAAAMIAVLLVRGGDESFRWALGLMLLATVIDSTDGWLARRARVKEVTPGFDGRRLDDLIDFQTYTSLPLLLIWRAEIFSGGQEWWLLLPLLAGVYGFSQTEAKTDDGYFLGFPSYWNVVAFYLYMLRPPEWSALGLIIALSVLTFVPTRYLYASKSGPFSRMTILLGIIWAVMLLLILLRAPQGPAPLTLASSYYPIYYMALSWIITFRLRQKPRPAKSKPSP